MSSLGQQAKTFHLILLLGFISYCNGNYGMHSVTKMINASIGQIYHRTVSRGMDDMYHVNSTEVHTAEQRVSIYIQGLRLFGSPESYQSP
eukprot:Seg4703.2 transcript_id=Seg4703.2/GoldUCD/mRNA.D3Y31 product="hypothetical protein" protein_id=Seg4703.2/GoldUCD/D3Y31